MKELGILIRESIREACHNHSLIIDPFEESHLQPTSYDVSVVQVLENGVGRDFDSLRIEYLQFMNFIVRERLEFPLDIVGHIYLRSTFARGGLGVIHLGRIEAGWRGRLVIEVFNASRDAIVINKGERIATVEFIRLAKSVSKGYEGQFQDFGT